MLRPAAKQLKNRKNLIIAEIGVAHGIHASEMLKYLNIKKLYLIDPFVKYKDTGVDYDFSEAKPQKMDALMACRDKIEWIKKYSMEAVKDFEDEYFDFVYIDANHQYEYVLEDIKAWLPKVKKGGVLGGHDYDLDGVKKAVAETFKNVSFANPELNVWSEIIPHTISTKNPSGRMTTIELKECSKTTESGAPLFKVSLAPDWWAIK